MGSASFTNYSLDLDTPVVLNVYDLTPVNNYTSWFGFGIFHSGIEGALCSCLLPESLQATSAKQQPEYHECTEDGTESISTATPRESIEIDHDQEKLLWSPSAGSWEVAFVKETQK